MADRKQLEVSKIDALYSWISYDLQKLKGELLNEMKYSSVQVGSLYKEIKNDKDKSSQAISQEIRYSYKQNQTIYDGLASMLTEEVGTRLGSIEELQTAIEKSVADIVSKIDETNANVAETVKTKVAEVIPQLEEAISEIKYGYVQQQAVYDGLSALIQGEVVAKLDDMQAKLAMLEQIDSALTQIQEKIAEAVTMYEDNDYKAVIESVAEKTEESVAEHSRQVLDAVAAIPVAENVDYNRIVDEVGDKVLELLGEVMPVEEPAKAPVEATVDYDKIVYGTAEKVVESLPYPEKVDYRRIDASFVKAAATVQAQVSEDALTAAVSAAVEKAIASLDLDALATKVAEKVVVPVVEAPEIDYDRLSEMVAAKLAANTDQTYDVVLDETGINQIAEKVAEKLDLVESTDYDRIANIVEEKCNNMPEQEPTYELVVDEEGVQAIAKSVAEELRQHCEVCEATAAQAPAEEVVEVVEEPVAEVVEEVVEETPADEELAVAVAPVANEEKQHVDAEAGLVDRLNRSFTAKMKQSDDKVKRYYSDIRNELTSYKKINSNVSWNGDRFNFGRETIAKVIIRGKTLRFLLKLDPEDPEYKQSVYHQKNVGNQKAHEDTPFMVNVTSDMAARKSLRLVGFLAEKLGAEKDAKFEPVDYAQEFAYEDDVALEEAGYIKRTKEKKVDFNF